MAKRPCWSRRWRRSSPRPACRSRTPIRGVAAAAAILVAGLAVTNETSGLLRVTPGTLKAMRRQMDELPSARIAQTGWNAYSRIDAVEGFPAPYLARLYIDSDAWTSILEWDGNLDGVRDMRTWYRALPFKLVPNAAHARHRPRRRLRRARRARVGQPQGHARSSSTR